MTIPLAQPVVDGEMISEATRVLQNEYFLGGPSVELFEQEFAEHAGSEHAVAVSSGTQALHLSLRALGVSEGDRVITTPATFISTGNAILRTGAVPKFVDISLETYTMDINAVRDAMDPKVAAVLPVHLYGFPVDIPALEDIVDGTPIVADACQAHGAKLEGRDVGALGTMAAFSFYPSKNMTVGGDGGMVTTDDHDLASRLRTLRDVGRDIEGRHVELGYTARLGSVNAAIGRKQLERLNKWNQRRKRIAAQYRDHFSSIKELNLPPDADTIEPAWYFYVIRTEHRRELAAHMEERGIETGVHYNPPVHRQQPYTQLRHDFGEFPNSDKWAREVLSLPVHPHLTAKDVSCVIDSVVEFFR